MPLVKLQVRTGPRQPAFPREDEALGMAAWNLLSRAVTGGRAPPALFVLTDSKVHLVDLRPALPHAKGLHRLVASLAGVPGAEAVVMAGLLHRRRYRWPAWRYAVAFVEWSDNRWWLAHRRVGDDGQFLPDADVDVLRAVDGLSRPGGLGGWFSRMRFEGLRAEFTRVEGGTVH